MNARIVAASPLSNEARWNLRSERFSPRVGRSLIQIKVLWAACANLSASRKERVMTINTILILSGIASAFMLFGGVLAWGDFYSRGVSRDQAKESPASLTPVAAPIEHRKAA